MKSSTAKFATPQEEVLRNKQMVALTINAIRKRLYPDWSRDQLLCHPEEAMSICELARGDLAFIETWSDYQILFTYLNQCKRSKVPSGIPGKGGKRCKA
jgi:hypothetical protein